MHDCPLKARMQMGNSLWKRPVSSQLKMSFASYGDRSVGWSSLQMAVTVVSTTSLLITNLFEPKSVFSYTLAYTHQRIWNLQCPSTVQEFRLSAWVMPPETGIFLSMTLFSRITRASSGSRWVPLWSFFCLLEYASNASNISCSCLKMPESI